MVLLLLRILKGLWWLVTLLPRLVRWLVGKIPSAIKLPVGLALFVFGMAFLFWLSQNQPSQAPTAALSTQTRTVTPAPIQAPRAPIVQPVPPTAPPVPATQAVPVPPTSPPAAPTPPQTQTGVAEALRLGLSGVSRDLGQGLAALQAQLEAQAAQLRELSARPPASAPPPAASTPPPAVSAPVAPPQAAPQRAPRPQARPQEVIPAGDPRNQAYMGGGIVTQPVGGAAQAESRGPGGIFGNKGRLSGQ